MEKGKAASRGRAKRAVVEGRVCVDGSVITKPSRHVGYNNVVEVLEDIDVPAGFMKLKDIQDKTGIIHPGDMVLDLGSSAGGFLLFASGVADRVRGVEYSSEFIPLLEDMAADHENISVAHGDIFTMPLSSLSEEVVDVILNDITVEPDVSIQVLKKVLPLLKPGGRVLQVLKLPGRTDVDPFIDSIRSLGLHIRHIIKSHKREIYVVAVQIQSSEALQ